MKKTWIKIKRGLLDPKHRDKLGIRIWLYLYILDQTDWETGKIFEWRDKDAAFALQMPWRTLQQQRQQLAEDGYISSEMKGNKQVITIHNWTSPREYSGDIYNPIDGGTESRVPRKNAEGTREGTREGIRKPSTPSYRSQITDHNKNGGEPPEPPPKPVKKGKSKKKRDPRLDNPAIIAYRDEAHLHVAIPWREEVCKVVDDPERWKELVHDWIGHGWNKQNIKDMLQAYRNGGIGKNKSEPAGYAGIRDYLDEEQEKIQNGN